MEELKSKLKEKETMLRIAKYKLTEVNRNIKQGQVTLANAESDPAVLDPAYVAKPLANSSSAGVLKEGRNKSVPPLSKPIKSVKDRKQSESGLAKK